MSYRCISFLTDYGLEDGFAAACHGVMAALAPTVPRIDITHLIPRGDVRRGSAVLIQTVPFFPSGVHLAVVDPGVGTARRAVAIRTPGHLFVGPDNGLLVSAAEASGGVAAAREISSDEVLRRPVSATFHGRDVFAPAAALLAVGFAFDRLGASVDPSTLVRLPTPAYGEVLTIDHFGNVQLAVNPADVRGKTVRVAGRSMPYADTFATVSPGEFVAYADSAGYLAVAVNDGSAAERLGLAAGQVVDVEV
jgi:S-adenosylmethionine hydrolase